MKKLSIGLDSTLGSYLYISCKLYGKKSAAVEFLLARIKESPNGINQPVLVSEQEMFSFLMRVNKQD